MFFKREVSAKKKSETSQLKYKVFVAIIRFVAIVCVVAPLLALMHHIYNEFFSPEIRDGEVFMKKLENAVVNSDGKDVELKSLTSFQWDKVCFEFGDLMDVNLADKDVSEYLGFITNSHKSFYIPDSHIAIMFVTMADKDFRAFVVNDANKINFEYNMHNEVQRCFLFEDEPFIRSTKTKRFDGEIIYDITIKPKSI